MDTDLFQILTLILLLGLLLTLFGVLQSLGAIRRALEGRGSTEAVPATTAASSPSPEPEPEPQTQPEPEPQVSTWAPAGDTPAAATTAAEPEPARTGWPAPQEATPEPAPTLEDRIEPAASSSSGGGARVLYGDTGLTTATPSEAAVRPAESEPEPEPEPAATAATTSSAADDPQEQPFERDGRWWFRRGDELLVYEEQTGQWVAADASPAATAGGAAATAGTAATAGGATDTGASGAGGATPAEGQVTTQQEAVGSFWKCPSCGAVNGSTATSCRMCFTARP